ncbi:MAG: sugar transferase, partial [Tepidiformaceae bacterium]
MATSVAPRRIREQPARELILVEGMDDIDTVPMPLWKRTIDIVGAFTGLLVLSPLFGLIALIIVLDSRGAPFFRQTRVGHGGRTFTCWKFRSMQIGA